MGVISTVAGMLSPAYTGDGGPASAAALYRPQGIAVAPSGDLIIADTFNNVVRKVNRNIHQAIRSCVSTRVDMLIKKKNDGPSLKLKFYLPALCRSYQVL